MEYNGYNIEGDGSFGMKIIKTVGRGSLPLELRGAFLSVRDVCRAIDIIRSKKEKPDAEVFSTSRG